MAHEMGAHDLVCHSLSGVLVWVRGLRVPLRNASNVFQWIAGNNWCSGGVGECPFNALWAVRRPDGLGVFVGVGASFRCYCWADWRGSICAYIPIFENCSGQECRVKTPSRVARGPIRRARNDRRRRRYLAQLVGRGARDRGRELVRPTRAIASGIPWTLPSLPRATRSQMSGASEPAVSIFFQSGDWAQCSRALLPTARSSRFQSLSSLKRDLSRVAP